MIFYLVRNFGTHGGLSRTLKQKRKRQERNEKQGMMGK
jgi:hypothetical protein